MGITGAPFGRTELLIAPPGIARTSSCSGEGSQGAWGLGRWENVEKCFIVGSFFKTFLHFSIFEGETIEKTRNLTNLLGLSSYRFRTNPRVEF